MKAFTSRLWFFALCLGMLLLSSRVMLASVVTVDCSGATSGAFTSFASAVASLTPTGPNTINVVSNCTDHIFIVNSTNLSIFGNPGTVTITSDTPTMAVLSIIDSTNVTADGVNFSGGQGIFINNSLDVFVADGAMQNSGGLGVTSLNSVVDIFNFAIQNSVRSGIDAEGGAVSLLGAVTVSNNGRFGISMQTGHLSLLGGTGTTANPDNVISNNGFFGVSVLNSGELDASGGNDITNNGFMGVRVGNTSTVEWSGGGTITGNQGVGIHVSGTSHADIDTVTISGNGASVAANGGEQSNFGAAGGIEIVENSDGVLNGAVNVTGNMNTGIFTNESSVLSSNGGNTVNNNAGDGFLLTTLSVAHFFGVDTATGNTLEQFACDTSSVLIANPGAFNKASCADVKLK